MEGGQVLVQLFEVIVAFPYYKLKKSSTGGGSTHAEGKIEDGWSMPRTFSESTVSLSLHGTRYSW